MQTTVFILSLLATLTQAVDKTVNPELVAKLKSATTALDRQDLLPKDSDWTFDFYAQKKYTYSPGSAFSLSLLLLFSLLCFACQRACLLQSNTFQGPQLT